MSLQKQTLAALTAVIIGVVLALSTLMFARGAGNGTFSLSAAPTSVTTGSTFDVTLRLNTGSQGVDYVEALVGYNPAQVRYESTNFTGGVFETALDTSNSNGTLTIQRGTSSAPSTGNQLIGVIRFTMLANSGSSQISMLDGSEQGYFDTGGVYQDYWNHASVTTTVSVTPPADTTAPSVPGNLRVTGQTTTSVSLAWNVSTDPSGIFRYEVRRNGTVVGNSTALVYTDTGLTAGQTYQYSVRAVDNSPNRNASAYTGNVPGTTSSNPAPPADTTAPTVPSNLRFTSRSTTTIDLAWNSSTDASDIMRYEVFRDGAKIGDSTGNATTYKDTGLTPGREYTYTVRALDNSTAHNASSQSSGLKITTVAEDGTAPPPVVVPAPTTNNTTSTPKPKTNPIPPSLPAATPSAESPIATRESRDVQYKKAIIAGTLSRSARITIAYGFVDSDGSTADFVTQPVNASGTYEVVLDPSLLIPGVTYYYQVVATDSAGKEHRSEPEIFTTKGFTARITVTDKNNKPLKNTKVTLHSDPIDGETNDEGFVEFTNITPGAHEVQAQNGDETVAAAITVADNVTEVDGVQTAEPQTFAVSLPIEQKSSSWLIWAIPTAILVLVGAAVVVMFIRRGGGLPPLAFSGNNPSLPSGSMPVVGGQNLPPAAPPQPHEPNSVIAPASQVNAETLEDRLRNIEGASTFAPGQVITPKDPTEKQE